MNTLRYLAAKATSCEDSTIACEDFLRRTTEGDLEDAIREYNEWFEREIDTLTVEKSNDAMDAIWTMANAKAQYHYENGYRAGVEFGRELYRRVSTEEEITARTRTA